MSYVKGGKLREGKTKIVWAVEGRPDLCILTQKNDVTANDDPSATRQFATKAVSATETTCNVFRLLASLGVPVAFTERIDDTSFLAPVCQMIPLECVARRYAVGSYLKHNPGFPVRPAHRFRDPIVEFYLKTTRGVCIGLDGRPLLTLPDDPLLADGRKVEDPLILDVHPPAWRLQHSKLPTTDPRHDIGVTIPRSSIIEDLETDYLLMLLWHVFRVLEGAWIKQDCHLVDLKIELGFTASGKLCVADVITPDEWRLRTADGEELSKQRFRDGDPLAAVEDVYVRVAEMSKRLMHA
jgi:phosphoribosylaminoimidazole-succinocarboxamide synthase